MKVDDNMIEYTFEKARKIEESKRINIQHIMKLL